MGAAATKKSGPAARDAPQGLGAVARNRHGPTHTGQHHVQQGPRGRVTRGSGNVNPSSWGSLPYRLTRNQRQGPKGRAGRAAGRPRPATPTCPGRRGHRHPAPKTAGRPTYRANSEPTAGSEGRRRKGRSPPQTRRPNLPQPQPQAAAEGKGPGDATPSPLRPREHLHSPDRTRPDPEPTAETPPVSGGDAACLRRRRRLSPAETPPVSGGDAACLLICLGGR
jgi:hypothetical protein